jgi:hypothetical protein
VSTEPSQSELSPLSPTDELEELRSILGGNTDVELRTAVAKIAADLKFLNEKVKSLSETVESLRQQVDTIVDVPRQPIVFSKHEVGLADLRRFTESVDSRLEEQRVLLHRVLERAEGSPKFPSKK